MSPLARGKWRLVPLTVRLPSNLHRRLAGVARDRGTTVAHVVYQAVESYLGSVPRRVDSRVYAGPPSDLPLATLPPKQPEDEANEADSTKET